MRPPRYVPILVGAVVGALAGGLAHLLAPPGDPVLAGVVRWVAQPVGQVFLRLLFMLVVPLVVSALVLGVAGLGDLASLARVGWRTLLLTAAVSAVAVALGVGLVAAFEPGRGMPAEQVALLSEGAAERAAGITGGVAPKTGLELLVGIVPSNVVKAAADGDLLALMFFATLFGVGMLLTGGEHARRLALAAEAVFEVSMRLIDLALKLAPLGVAALLFTLPAELGWDVLVYLARYVGVALLAMAIHQFGVYSLIVAGLGRMSPWRFFRGVQPAMVTAFATASSNATLPTSLKVAEETLRLPRQVSRFVLTVGATANQNGTALFEGVTVLFLAQLYGVPLTLAQQVLVVLVCVLGGIGTAGVPAGSIPVVALILGMVGVPVEGIGLILGVDRFLDMCRTTLNVTGDLAIAVAISRGEPDVPDPAAAVA